MTKKQAERRDFMKKHLMCVCALFFCILNIFSVEKVNSFSQEEAAEYFSENAIEKIKKLEDTSPLLRERLLQTEEDKTALLVVRSNENSSSEEKAALVTLDKAYKTLESGFYTATSLTGGLTLTVSSFNRASGGWYAHVTSGRTGSGTFSHSALISYEALTGEKFVAPEEMTRLERKDFERIVAMYNALFARDVIVIYAQLKYKVESWENASEYRLVPDTCQFFRVDKSKAILELKKNQMESSVFSLEPEIEIRTPDEIQADKEKISQTLKSESEAKQKTLNQEKESNKKSESFFDAEQKGRKAIFLSVDTAIPPSDFVNFDLRKISLNSITLNFMLGIGKFGFAGGLLGYDYLGNHQDNAYCAGFLAGGNYTLNKHLRVFAEGKASYHTNYKLCIKHGLGIDLIIGKLLGTVGWDFDLYFDFTHPESPCGISHDFFAGLGVTW